MKVSCEKLRELKLLRDYEIIDFCEDEDSSDVYIVYADREVRDNCVEVHAVVFDIEKENLEFSPRNYRKGCRRRDFRKCAGTWRFRCWRWMKPTVFPSGDRIFGPAI